MKFIIRPRNVYVVINTNGGWIAGCFYSEESAHKYVGHTGNHIVKELPVETHGLKLGIFERLMTRILG